MVCFASLISPENIDYLKNTYINSKENLFALQTPQKLKKAQLRLVFYAAEIGTLFLVFDTCTQVNL